MPMVTKYKRKACIFLITIIQEMVTEIRLKGKVGGRSVKFFFFSEKIKRQTCHVFHIV